jgi:hypothetical protein
MSQSAACARCDKQDCSSTVIIPAIPDRDKKFDTAAQSLELICPACHRLFSTPIREIKYLEVTDEQLSLGFMDGPPLSSTFVH